MNCAGPDLCGGCPAMGIPTAIPGPDYCGNTANDAGALRVVTPATVTTPAKTGPRKVCVRLVDVCGFEAEVVSTVAAAWDAANSDGGVTSAVFREALRNFLLALPQQFDFERCQPSRCGRGTEPLLQ